MKNKYFIDGEVVTVFIKYKKEVLETLVDIDDLEKIKNYNVTWYGNERNGNVYVVANNSFIEGKAKVIKLHQLILDFPSRNKELVVDHINRDTLDNRKENLRIVTRVENAQNSGLPSNNKSGVKGVHFNEKDKVWVARISINGKRKSLGTHHNKEDAIKARKDAELKYWAENGGW